MINNKYDNCIINNKAKIHKSVKIGPFSIIDENVSVGKNTVIGPHVHIFPNTIIGEDNIIHQGSVIGGDPQDLKFNNEKSKLIIGNRNTIREYCTLNRGTEATGKTVIGDDCLLMAYVHVAHDCIVKDKVILANSVQLAGHSIINYHAIIGGMTGIHQFCRVGEHSFVGACRVVLQDVPPYILATGDPLKYSGINSVGLRRRNFSAEQRNIIKKVYKIIYLSKFNVRQSISNIKKTLKETDEINNILRFINESERGLI